MGNYCAIGLEGRGGEGALKNSQKNLVGDLTGIHAI